MKDLTHIRKGKVITEVNTNIAKDYKTVNKAKRASHKIQMDQDGGLGRGSVQKSTKHQVQFDAGSIVLSEEQLTRMRTGK